MDLEKAQEAFLEYKRYKCSVVKGEEKLPDFRKIKRVYPFTQMLLRLITAISGEKIVSLKQDNIKVPNDRTVIWANTHRFKPDFEKISIKTKRPSSIIASDFCGAYKNISGWYFNTRAAIFVDPYSTEDKTISYQLMKMYLDAGMDFMIFPEAVWNLSENLIVLDTFYGTVKAALETNSLLICTAIERYGKHYVINRSEVIDMNIVAKRVSDIPIQILNLNDDKQKNLYKKILGYCNSVLRDTLATLLYEIWEEEAKKNGLCKRNTLSDDYWERFVGEHVAEWPTYKMSDNVEQRFQNRDVLLQRQIENDLSKLRNMQIKA